VPKGVVSGVQNIKYMCSGFLYCLWSGGQCEFMAVLWFLIC